MIDKETIIKLLKPPSPSLNRNKKFLNKLVDEISLGNGLILDLGSGGRLLKSAISLDLIPQGIVDVVGDAAKLPFKSSVFALVVCTAVFEHVDDINSTIEEIFRILKRSARLYVEVPFLQTFHGDPSDFRRYTLVGLEKLLWQFSCVSSGFCIGPFSALAWLLRKIPATIITNHKMALATEALAGWLTFWIKYLDYLLPKMLSLHQVASGIYFLGEKEK